MNEYRERGYGEVGPNRAVYLAALESIDRSVGRLMAKLEELGIARNTMVVFLSDNGGVDERFEHRSLEPPHPPAPRFGYNLREYANAPLRDGKGSNYEGGIRVPLIVRWPGAVRGGTVIQTPVHAIDMAPTLLSAAIAPLPENHRMDGRSLTRLMQTGSDESLDDRPLYQYYAAYDFNWGLTPSASIRKGDYKLIEFFGDRVDTNGQYIAGHHIELYNLRKDTGEEHDLTRIEADRAADLVRQLRAWIKDMGAEIPRPNPHHDPGRAFLTTGKKPDWLRPNL